LRGDVLGRLGILVSTCKTRADNETEARVTIGIEWVLDYHGSGNLSNTRAQAEGLYNTLSGVRSFNFGNDLAWDQDFEEQGVGSPVTGDDAVWVDNVDIAFFSGHGNSSGVSFGRKDRDDGAAKNTDVRWGNKRLKWIALDACEVLQWPGVFDRWRNAFRGLHYMLGFHTLSSDESKRGRYFAENLNKGWSVRNAWIRACQDTEGSHREWAYLRADGAGTDTFNDHWIGKGFVSPDPSNPTSLFYLRGSC
jgi:uncharacterized protein DUF6345